MNESLYQKARALLLAHPEMGKQKLASLLGVKTPTTRRFKYRFRGETEGHDADPVYLKVRQLKENHAEWGAAKIAHALGISVDHAKIHLARWLGAQTYAANAGPGTAPVAPTMPLCSSAEPAPAGCALQDTVTQESRDLCYRGEGIKTLRDLLTYAQVDASIWEVEKHTINKWEVGSKGPTGEILTAPLFQIKAWLRRKVMEERLQDLMQGMLTQFREQAPIRPGVARPTNGEGVLEISIMDLHLGKMAWGAECGRDYSPEIAERMFWEAIEDLLNKASGLKPFRILIPCGNDFFNTDFLGKATTSGTVQDEAMTWKQSFCRGKALLVQAIQRLREVAPVHVVCVAGNHDTTRLYFLGEVLAAYFGRTDGVTVDNSPRQRKYVHFGQNLLGLTHGCHEKHLSLPLIMASEAKEAWAASRHREWHVGHWHAKRHKPVFTAEDTHSVLVRVVPSLCPADAWHASMGYGGKLAAEAYYWDKDEGCVATFTHSAN